MRKAIIATLAVVALAVTGCSNDDGGVRTLSEVTGVVCGETYSPVAEEDLEWFVTEAGTCDDRAVYMFDSPGEKQSWVDIAVDFGGPYLIGENWTVSANQGTLVEVQDILGGDIVGGFEGGD